MADSDLGVGVGSPAVPGLVQSAVEPLYLTRQELLKAIRMYTAIDQQTVALLDSTIQDVRVSLYDALGATRVTTILAYDTVDNPTTENQLTKMQARLCETQWTAYKLLSLLPVNFMENEHTTHEVFNEEPLTRDAKALETLKNNLLNSVTKLLNRLKEPAESGDGSFSVGVIGRQDEDGDIDPYNVSENFIGLYQGPLV